MTLIFNVISVQKNRKTFIKSSKCGAKRNVSQINGCCSEGCQGLRVCKLMEVRYYKIEE